MGSGCSSNNNQPLTRKAPAVPGLKLVIVGDCEVGKTSVYLRYLHNQFCPIYTHTDKVNIDNVVQKINQPSHALTSLTLWDIPGREDVNLHPTYFRDMDGLIVVADLTEESSIRLAPVWKQLALNSAATSTGARQEDALPAGPQHVPVLLMGNKLDLVEEQMFADLAASEKEVVGEGGEVNSTLLSERKQPTLHKPASVQLLEQVSHSNFFTGSAVVSAKSGDGSVNQAVRSFVRHIMEKRVHMTRRWNPKVIEEKDKRSKDRATITLNDVGIPEFDELFGQGQVLVTRVSSLAALFKDTLTRFQDKCQTAGVTGEDHGASLENCLVGLREALALHSIGLKLQVKDDFCLLEAKSVEDKEIEKPIRYALKTFNKEFAAVCQTAVRELPTIVTSLDVLDAHLAKLCSHYQLPPPPPPHQVSPAGHNDNDDNVNNNSAVDVKAASEGIEKNRGKLVHCRHHARDLITKVETVLKKARTAFVW